MEWYPKQVCIVTWTRAEYWLLKGLYDRLSSSSRYEAFFAVTWMHLLEKYGKTIHLINADKTIIDKEIHINENGNMTSWLGEEIEWFWQYFKNRTIDLLIVLWDRNEAFAAVIAAAHFKIPVAHIHWWDITWHLPDDYIRNAISKMSHIHFTGSEQSKTNIRKIWEKETNINNVGAIWIDILLEEKVYTKNEVANKLWLDIEKPRFLIIHHPCFIDAVWFEEQITFSLQGLEEIDWERIIIYPNSDEWSNIFIDQINKYNDLDGRHIFKSLKRDEYISLLSSSDLLIGNSSSGIIESGAIWIKTINIWERQSWREQTDNIKNIAYTEDLKELIKQQQSQEKKAIKNNPYYKWWAANKIVSIIDQINDFKDLIKNK